MTEIITIRPLSPALLGDFLHFFDHDAFVDNPHWAKCYCFFNHAPHQTEDWESRTAAQNRASASQYIRERRMHGYLAYLSGKPVGWCNAAPRPNMTTLQDDAEPDAYQIGSIVCFVVASPYRNQGVAAQLLYAACEGFRSQGLIFAEGYPRKDAASQAANYHGPLAMFLAAGFEPVAEKDGIVTVRKRLR